MLVYQRVWEATVNDWLVVDLPLWKMMEWKSVGMIIPFPTEWKNISAMFQSPPTSCEYSKHMMMMIWAVHSLQIPSGKHTKSYWKWQFIVDLPINSMVIFHSYVSLPEGMRGHSKWLVGGWPTPLKNDGVKVSWDYYSIPNWMEKYFSHVPVTTNQLWI